MGKIIAFIPARSGSKRIPNKNIVQLNGHPLIAYSIYAAKEARIFDQIIVSTDSPDIANIAKQYGAIVNELRPQEISGETSPDIDWVNFELSNIDHAREDIVVILRPTNPLRKSTTIKSALNIFRNNQSIDSLRAIRKVKEHPSKMWRRAETGRGIIAFDSNLNKTTGTYNHSSPMQSLEELYIQDASLEITTVDSILSNQSISGIRIQGYIMPEHEGFDINYPEDLEYLNFLILTKKITISNLNMLLN